MLQTTVDYLIYNLIKLTPETHFAEAINFFIYDSVKILFLIFFVVALIEFIRTFVAGKLEKSLAKTRFGMGNLMASTFGVLTPFCSCSSIPIFIGFVKSRLPIGIAFSFLITSPLVNEVAFVIMGGLFGWKLASLYALSGIALGVIGGLILQALSVEKYLILEGQKERSCAQILPTKFQDRISFGLREGKKTFKKLWPFILGGVAIGATIHGYVPQDFFVNYIGQYSIFAVPAAVILGVPIYAGCSTVAPLVFTITGTGIPLGTSLAFMMSIAGLSLPEAIILKRVMHTKLLAMFFGIVAIGIICIGYLFNFLLV